MVAKTMWSGTMAILKVGDRISYNGDIGTVCDFENPNPPPATFISPTYKDALIRGWSLLVLFDDDIYKNNFYHPYYIVSATSVVLVESKVQPSSSYQNYCPLCGSGGDDLVFEFYCSNKKCRNFVK